MGFDDACFGDTEDDMIRTLLDSPHPFVAGITLEELERERFVRLRIPATVPALRRRRLRDARRQVPFPRGDAGLHAARGIAARRPGAAAEIPARADLARRTTTA